jgi:hypothetical protein
MLRQIMARNLALARTRLLLALCFHAAAAAAVGVGLDGVGARVVRRPLRACWPPI